MPDGNTLALVGGDISIVQKSRLSSLGRQGGKIRLDVHDSVLVAGDSAIDVGGSVSGVRIDFHTGFLHVDDSSFASGAATFGGTEQGHISLNLRNLLLTNSGRISNVGGQPVVSDSPVIDVTATDSVVISGRSLGPVLRPASGLYTSSSRSNVSGPLRISTGKLIMTDSAVIDATTSVQPGDATSTAPAVVGGKISIQVGDVFGGGRANKKQSDGSDF